MSVLDFKEVSNDEWVFVIPVVSALDTDERFYATIRRTPDGYDITDNGALWKAVLDAHLCDGKTEKIFYSYRVRNGYYTYQYEFYMKYHGDDDNLFRHIIKYCCDFNQLYGMFFKNNMEYLKNDPIENNIRYLRRRINMTQRELSEKSGVSLPTIALIETGKNHPSRKTLDKLMAVLNPETKE